MAGLDEWFSVQTMYDHKQIGQIEKRLTRRIDEMSADELEAYQQDLAAKLQMVLGPEGRDILEWVAANLAAAAPAYRRKMDLEYPDILQLTAAQLREQLDQLEQKRSTARNQTEALERFRQARIAAVHEGQRQLNEERVRGLDRGMASLGAGGYRRHPPTGGLRKYPEEVAYPPYGWGFGFW